MENIAKFTTFNSFVKMLDSLPDDKSWWIILKDIRWNNGTPTCPHCGIIDNI